MTNPERALGSIPKTGLEHTLHQYSQIVLALGKITMEFTTVKRGPRLHTGEREDNAQHSSMVGLIAPQLAVLLNETKGYRLNPDIMPAYALAHDKLEIITGDTLTFKLTPEERDAKKKREHEALEELCEAIGPYWARIIREYEEQIIPEARFVRAVDKAAPAIVHIYGQGSRVVSDDYGVRSKQELILNHTKNMRSLRKEFPDYPEVVDICEELFKLFDTVATLPLQPDMVQVIKQCITPYELQNFTGDGVRNVL